MSDFIAKPEAARGPATDLWRKTLLRIPTHFGRLVFLSSLRDALTGRYSHPPLSQIVGDEIVRGRGAGQPQRGVQLIHRAARLHARMIFRNAPAKHQRRRSRISRFSGDAHSPFTVATLSAFAKQNGC